MENSNKKIIYIGLACLFFITIGFFALLMNYSFTPIDNKDEYVVIDIPAEANFADITKILAHAGLIKNRFFFYSLVIIKKAKNNIKSGEYEINKQITPWVMINKLMQGEKKIYIVLIPEDLSVREIATRLDDLKLINKQEFLKLSKDKKFLESLKIKADSIEGYLFPDTYLLNRSMSTSEIMIAMVNNFWNKVTPEMIKRANELGFNIHQVVTLASIIGKESDINAKKPFISAKFHNRLKRGMRLQSSPTSVYDLDNFNGKILLSYLKRKSPYNTYVINGLPPGPIANPGLVSLKAALYPAPVDKI